LYYFLRDNNRRSYSVPVQEFLVHK